MGRPRLYCSSLCANTAYGRVGLNAYRGRVCRCGNPLPPGRTKVCSDKCWGTRPKGNQIPCRRCGGARDISAHGNDLYCARCREQAREESMRRNQMRRRRKIKMGGHHSERDWIRLLNRYDGRCAYCGEPATARDHVFPLTRGGTDTIGNILPACTHCNVSKYNLFLVEWRAGRKRA